VTEVTIWYLQACSEDELVAARNPGDLAVVEARIRQFELNRFLYQFVGGPWGWTDKLGWSEEQWRTYAEHDSLRTWVAWYQGSPAGYFELQKYEDARVEINYFGLAQNFIGRGFGGYLLSEAIRQAWAWGAERVTVNTCSLDHPGALANYQARGMKIYQTTVK
jgi:GNAT superfamily N-acetyltransferase